MKNIACIIARTNSTRLPNKVLKEINGKKIIEHIIERIQRCRQISEVYICTSTQPEDSVLERIASHNNVKYYAGSEESVIDRMLDVAKIEKANNLVRITGDNIFTDSVYIDLMLERHINESFEYTRTEYLPVGITSEVISVEALKKCYDQINPTDSQYLMLYMFQPEYFKCQVIIPPVEHRQPKWSLTIDTPEDFERTLYLFEKTNKHLSFEDLIRIGKSFPVPHLVMKYNSIVKLAANMIFYSDTIKFEKELRINNSYKEQISIDQYKKTLYEQQRGKNNC